MRKEIFTKEIYYHIYDRGVNSQLIFNDPSDFQRFYDCLYLFNDNNYKNPGGEYLINESILSVNEFLGDERVPLVSIKSFCLLPNHFHIMLEQIQDNGISRFLHRLKMGYARYFNLKHHRTGPLFDGRFNAKAVENEAHFIHLPRYIHLNALDLTEYNWREGRVNDWGAAFNFLNEYKWSSHHVYLGNEQSLSVVDENFIQQSFRDSADYVTLLKQYATSNPFHGDGRI